MIKINMIKIAKSYNPRSIRKDEYLCSTNIIDTQIILSNAHLYATFNIPSPVIHGNDHGWISTPYLLSDDIYNTIIENETAPICYNINICAVYYYDDYHVELFHFLDLPIYNKKYLPAKTKIHLSDLID